MLSRAEQLAQKHLIILCFDEVAKIEFVKNKWITAEAWFELIKKVIPNCAINEISLSGFIACLLNSH